MKRAALWTIGASPLTKTHPRIANSQATLSRRDIVIRRTS